MPGKLVIDGRSVSDQDDAYVIAEVGHNHQGSVETAKRLFAAAKEAGASAVKLQKRDNRSLYVQSAFDRPYGGENSYGPTYGRHREALEFGESEYRELQAYARGLGLTLFATAFDFKSADFLAGLGVPAYKVASGDLRNVPLVAHVARLGRPVLLSTGGAVLDDVRRAHDAARAHNPQVAVLQCTAAYPAEWGELDLRVIETYRRAFPDSVVGLSAHDSGIAMALAAYALGARVVEKHFTLNRAWKGTDHAFSLEPAGLRKLVRDLGRLRLALGDGQKKVHPSEHAPLAKMGKSVVAARAVPAGWTLTPADLAFKSPAGGLHPYQVGQVVGRRTAVALARDEAVRPEHLAPAARAGEAA